MKLTRRQFLQGCCGAAGALAGARIVGLAQAAEAAAGAGPDGPLFLSLFLRGGCDGLNLVAPVDDREYVAARTEATRLQEHGPQAGLPLGQGLAKLDFRLHPAASPLKELYDAGDLAIVHACGNPNGTRSHFDAMDLMDRGVAQDKFKSLSSGWLARHLEVVGSRGALSAVAPQNGLPDSLLGAPAAFDVPDLDGLAYGGGPELLASLRKLYAAPSAAAFSGASRGAFRALDTAAGLVPRDAQGALKPYSTKAKYGSGELADALRLVARLVKLDVGLHVAAVDFGGWDTHQAQGDRFPALVAELSRALAGFYDDLSRYRRRLTVVVMSEFGRRLKASESNGTDHGHGNVMLVLGGGINGGRMYGRWPGLAVEQLDNQVDLAVTTDYRAVLGEIVTRRLGDPQLARVFPGFEAESFLGLCRG